MNKKTSLSNPLIACMLAISLLLTPSIVWAYGGGGGSDSGGGGGTIGSSGSMGGVKSIDPWSPAELGSIFHSLTPEQKDTMVETFQGSTINKRDLLTIRQVFLEQNSAAANRDAEVMDALVKTLEVLDLAGQYAEAGLSWVPGVGWVTSGALAGARAGANAYAEGKDASEIAGAALTSGAAAALVGRFSPGNADSAFNNARAGFNIARNATNKYVQKRAAQIAAKRGAQYLGTKYVENTVQTGLTNLGNAPAQGAQNGPSTAVQEVATRVSAYNQVPANHYSPMEMSPTEQLR